MASWSCVNHVVLLDVVQSGIVTAWRAILLIDMMTLYDNEVIVWRCSLHRRLMYFILLPNHFQVALKLLDSYNAFCVIGAVDLQATFPLCGVKWDVNAAALRSWWTSAASDVWAFAAIDASRACRCFIG